MRWLAAALCVVIAACGGSRGMAPDRRVDEPSACRPSSAEVAEVGDLAAQGRLHLALLRAERVRRGCRVEQTELLVAERLADLGLDPDALAIYRRYSNNAEVEAAIARLEKRPDPKREISDADRERALSLYDLALEAREKKPPQYAEALRLFRVSYQHLPHPRTILQIGNTYTAMGNDVEARRAFARSLAIAERMSGKRAKPVVQARHSSDVTGLAFHPAGRWLASVSYDRFLILWDPATGTQLRRVDTGGVITAVDVSPSGRTIVTAGGAVRLWRAADLSLIRTVAQPRSANAVRFSGDGKSLVCGGDDRRVWVIDLASKRARSFEGHRKSVESVDIDRRGERVVSAGRDNLVRLVDARTGRLIKESRADGPVAFSPDGRLLAVAHERKVELWDRDGRVLSSDEGFDASQIDALVFHPNGTMVAAAGGGFSTVSWWRVEGVRLVKAGTDQGGPDESAGAVAFDPTTASIAWASAIGRIYVRALVRSSANDAQATGGTDKTSDETRAARGIRTLGHVADPVAGLAVHPTRPGLVVSSSSGAIRSLDLTAGRMHTVREREELPESMRSVDGIDISPSGDHLAVVRSWSVRLLALPSGRELRTFDMRAPNERAGDTYAWTARFSRDGSKLLLAGSVRQGRDIDGARTGRLVVFDVDTGKRLATRNTPLPLWAQYGRRSDRILSTRGGTRVWTPSLGTTTIQSKSSFDRIEWGPREVLAAGVLGNTVALLGPDLRTLSTFGGHRRAVLSVAFDPTGSTLVSGSRDKTVRVWGTDSRRPLLTLSGHGADVTQVAVTPNGQLISSGSADGTVRFWDAHTGAFLSAAVFVPSPHWLMLDARGGVQGSRGAHRYILWRVGPYQLPGHVGWTRATQQGLVQRLRRRFEQALRSHRVRQLRCPAGTSRKGTPQINQWCERAGGTRHGPWMTRHRNGRLRSRGRYEGGKLHGESRTWFELGGVFRVTRYRAGKRHGESIWRHANGSTWRVGSYSGGKTTGVHTWYDERGKRSLQRTYRAGVQEGLSKSWRKNGRLAVEVEYVAGKRHGREVLWHPNGRKQQSSRFVGGKRTGAVHLWWPNGKRRGELEYRDSVLHGPARFWHQNGARATEARYLAGKPDGVVHRWHPSGKPRLRTSYQKGTRHGPSTEWFANGVKKVEGRFEGGARHGEWRWYWPSGKPKQTRGYHRGTLSGPDNQWYENGQPERSATRRDGRYAGAMNTWHRNGKRASSMFYRKGVAHGLERRWAPNGALVYRVTWSNGNRHGQEQAWTSKGVPRRRVTWRNGAKHGVASHWWRGKRERSETWRNGVRHGDSHRYYRSGKPSSTVAYRNGRRHGLYRRWGLSGALVLEGRYEQGRPVGVWKTRRRPFGSRRWVTIATPRVKGKKHGVATGKYDSGKRYEKTHWVEGKRHGTSQRWSVDGKLIHSSSWKRGKREGAYLDVTAWGRTEAHYRDGKLHGVERRYGSGKLVAESRWVDGRRHGPSFSIANGIKTAGAYRDGKKHGRFVRTDAKGKVIEILDYSFDRLVRRKRVHKAAPKPD